MPLSPGTALGPYQITGSLGAGGMGEVYSATDTRLDRTVAIKVLPAELASDPDRRERFEREAKAIAALNHPHICTLHDVGHEDGTDFLVMEHLEGESLQDRLTKGAVPLDQALQSAIQIADALDKAHRQGITHRDLKPGNIFLTKKAGAKLLHFGLAKFTDARSARLQPSEDPSTKLADALTAQGTILGTFHYMAPEQLEGGEADARSDIWAFGCVVYEMVTGTKAFEGTSQASLISAIMSSEPPAPSTLQGMSPPVLDWALTKCLSKSPDDRWQTASDLSDALDWVATSGLDARVAVAEEAGSPSPSRPLRSSLVAVTVTAVVAGLAFSGFAHLDSVSPRPVIRSVLQLPTTDAVGTADTLALSPDGARVAYSATRGGVRQLFVQARDELRARPILGTEGGRHPFFSPDSQWVGYFAGGSLLKVALTGGAPMTICATPVRQSAAWGHDETIVFPV